MKPGNYAVKDGAATVAYIRVTPGSTTVTPKGIKANALDELRCCLEEGTLPEGYVVRAMEVETGLEREKPNWKEMTPSLSKRQRWLRARQSR